jgi:hypothetical protein
MAPKRGGKGVPTSGDDPLTSPSPQVLTTQGPERTKKEKGMMLLIDRLGRTALLLGLVLTIMLLMCASANAVLVAHSDPGYTYSSAELGTFGLYAEVDLTGGVYTYTYNLHYISGGPTVHEFAVENPNNCQWSNQANSITPPGTTFNNPGLLDDYWVIWNGGNMPVSTSGVFSYKSTYGPQTPHGYCYTLNAGEIAVGDTIVMSADIPEPSSLIALAVPLLGIAPKLIRRRKSSQI